MFGFSEQQIQRYSRHIILPCVGGRGQRKLLESQVLLIGAKDGAEYLAREQNPFAVKAVRKYTCDQAKQETGQGCGHQHQAHAQG